MRTPTFKLDRTTLPTSVESLRLSPVCLAALVASGLAGVVPSASATPQGGTVTAGTATILTPKAGQMEIRQGSNAASIDWRSFSVGANESLRIVQPSSQSVLVNRVIGNDPSQILGRIDANGRVFLSNPRGILFGRDAVVDVGGLLATTLAISGGGSQYSLSGSSEAPGSIVVEGQLRAPGGLLAFAGPQITLGGQLEAQRVAAAAVNAVHIDIDGDGLVFFKPRNDEQLDAKLKVLGTIKADGGVVDLRAAARAGLADTVLNMDGLVQARSIGTRNGQVFINGGAVGDTVLTGKIDVSGSGTGERGGDVRVLGQRVGLFGAAQIDASGAAGGGLVHVGGGFQGQGEPLNASMTVVGAKASIQASATEQGNGGQVVVWADGLTRFEGTIAARGGARGGNGGEVETSGKQTLRATGAVDASASLGKGGSWLLDPHDISIDNVASNSSVNGSFVSTGDSAVVSNTVLGSALTGGTTVRVQAGSGGAGGGSQDGTITVNSTVTSLGSATLALDARKDIVFTAAGKLKAGAGKTLAVQLNAGSDAGFTNPGSSTSAITMAAGSEIVTLGGDLSATAKSSGITLAGISTGAGSLTVNSNGGAIAQNSALTVDGAASFNAGAASIALTNASNSFTGAVALNTSGSGTASIQSGSLDLAASTVGGALTAISTSGVITQSGVITLGADGNSFSSAAGQAITLTGANVFNGRSIALNSGADASITGDALTFAASTVIGKLVATASTGSITQIGALDLRADGNSFSTSTAGQTIELTAFNLFNGRTVALSTIGGSGNASLSGHNLKFATSTIGGTLTVNASSGGISQSGAISTGAGGSSFSVSIGNSIDLSTQANSLAGLVNGSDVFNTQGDLGLRNQGDIQLGSTTVSGKLVLISDTGAITQTGAFNVGADGSRFTTSSAGQAITLVSANVFNGKTVALHSGADASIAADALKFANSTIGGKLIATARTGSITQTGALTLNADGSSFSTSGGQAITLNSANVLNGKTVALNSGADASITADALKFAASTVGGKLVASASTGAITQTGALYLFADGNSFFTAPGQAITLNSDNVLNGKTVAFNSGGDVGITADEIKFAASTVGGKLVATSSSGSITQTGALNLGADGNSFFTAPGRAITLNSANVLNGKTVALSSGGDAGITADALKFAASTVGGKLVASASTGAITQTGALNLGADGNSFSTAAGQAITLNSANVLHGTTVALHSGADAGITADALKFEASTVSGKLLATSSSGSITQTGALNLGADGSSFSSAQAITLGSANVLNGKTVALTSSADTSISADALKFATSSIGGKLIATASTGGITQTGVLNLGADGNSFSTSAANQAITLTAANQFNGKTVALNTSGGSGHASLSGQALKFATSTIGGTLTANASNGGISQSGAISTGLAGSSFSVSAGQSIDLSTQANSLAGLSSGSDVFNTSGDLGLRNLAGIQLGATTVSGKLVLISDSGSISQTGAFNIGADGSSFSTSAGQAITLNSANVLNGKTVALNSGADASITADALKFAASTVGGKLVASASTGAITQTGALNLGADGNSFSTTAGQAITLNSANVLNGKTVALNSGADAGITADAIKFAASTVSGKLVATSSSGSITQTGALSLGADGSSFSSAQAITLNSANVLNGKTVALNSGGDAGITADALKFAASTIGGKLVASASTGAITQTGALNLGADGNSFTTAAGQAITLNSANVLNGKTVALSSDADASITADALKFAASTVSGKLLATASSGSITQTGALNLGADGSSFSSAQAITLGSANVLNGKTVALTSSADTSISADALKFATSSIGGKLIATASTGGITQTGVLNLGADGNSFSTSAANQAITLTAANQFNGKTVALNTSGGSGHASLSGQALKFATSTIGGTLTANASNGGISQSGAISTGLAGSSFSVSAGQSIDLSTQANSLAGLVNGSDVFNTQGDLGLRNVAGIQLGSTTVAGKLVLVSDTGAISQTGAFNVGADGSSFTTSSAGQAVTLSSANVFNGKTVAIHSGADASITADALKFASSTIAGKLIATATSGSITQTGALSLGANGNSFSTSGASRAITLNAANLFGSNTVAFNSSADTSITADTLKFATSSIGGKLIATATSGSITETGTLTLGADGNSFTTSGTSQAITLNAANTFAGKTVALNSSADASITADTLKFAASTISGKLVATASSGSISQTGALNLGADGNSFSTAAGQAITLGSANVLNSKTVALNSGGDAAITADTLKFAASTISGKLVATSNSGSITQTGLLNLGADGNSFSSAQAITLNSANLFNGKTVELTSGADTSITADALKFATSSIGGKLVATARTGSITQTGALNLGADGNSFSTAAGQAITLNSANVFNGKTVALSSGADASIAADALKFAASTVSGKLLATSSSGGISQTGALNLGADGNLFQSAQGVTLASANLFNGKTVALTSGSDATLTGDALKFASSTIGGKLVATASAGAITQTGGLNLGADGNSFTSSAGQAISLTGANVLNGKTVAIHSGASASISADALKFAVSTVSGDFTATATSGAISQSGALSIAGTSHLNAGSNAINLSQANDFQGLVHLAGGDTQVRDINSLALATAQVGNLTLNSQGALNLGTTTASQLTATSQGGAITQTGVLTVAGDSSLDAGSGSIVLTQANALAGRVSLTGGSAELNNQQALSLGNLSVGALGVSSQGPLNLGSGQAGSLVANSHGGAITQSGALQIAGSSQLNAGAADITLDQAGNDFQSTLSLTGGRVQLRDQNALSLGTLQTGALTLRSQGALLLGAGDLASLDARSEGGAITQSGVLRVLGDASLNAGSGALQLTQANEWRGAVRVDAATVNLNSATALNLSLASGGAAVLRTAGDLQLSGQSQSLDAASGAAITLGTTQVDQQLILSSQQGLRQSAGSALQVGGGSQILAAGQTVDLRGTQGGPSNRFGGEIDIQAASLQLRAQGPLRAALHTSAGAELDGINDAVQLRGHVGGDLISHSAADTTIAGLQVDGGAQITAGTSLGQSAALHVAGASRISSGTGSLNLEQADNQFGATVQLQAGSAARLRAASALDGVINSGPGDSRVESLGNQLTVTGQTAGALQLESAGSLNLGALQTAAGLQARAEQGVSQSAALNLGASSRIESRRAALLLDHTDNRFQGTLQLQSGGSLDLNSAGNLDLNLVSGQGARINSLGSLSMSGQSAGALRSRSATTTAFAGLQVAESLDSEASSFSQSGALIVGRDAQLRATAGGARLDQAGNRFGGALSLSASGGASLSSSQDLVLTLQTEEQASIQLGQGQLTLSAQARKGLSVESGGGVQLAASQVDGVLSIQAQGPVTQNAALRTQGLLLTGPGAVQLTHADNQIGSLAVRSAGVAEGAIAVRSASALRVATLQGVGGETVAGIQRQGDVSLQTGSAGLSLEAGIATGSNTLRLESSGAVSQNEAATIQAARLALLGAGSFQLQSAGNRIDAVAMSGTPAGAGLSAARDGSVSLRTAGALQVDTVQGLQGIQRQGDVSLRSDSGALRLNQAAQAQGSLLVLQAAGTVSQASGATVQATGLELRGAGAVQLDQAGNRVERLAALGGGGAAGSDGALRFLNSATLELGTVLSSGVQRQGDVSVRSSSGDLLLSQPIQLGGATLRLDSAQGRIQQSGGRIEAGSLGLRAAEGIALGQDNAWSGRVAARSERGDLLLHNSQGYTVAELAGDGDLFAGTRGLAAPAAGAAAVLNTGSGLVQQAAGAGILAEGLELQGAAAYSLKDASNQVQRFAAVQGGANDGAIDYVDQDGFEVSSVKASGIQRSGRVQLSNAAGQLTLEPQAASLVSLQGGTVSVASPQLVDGQLSLPVFTLSGTIALDKGQLSLKALQGAKVDAERLGRYQAELGLAKEVILVDAAGRPVKILADVFVQNSGAIRVAEGAQLHLQAEQGASASLLQTGNDFSGGFSASLGKANAAGSTEDRGPRSLLQLAGQTIQLKNEGVAADLLHFTADRMSTVDQAQITARMSFNNTLGTLTQMPALVFNFGSQAATPSNPNPFGVQPSGSLKVQVGTDGLAAQGGAEAGYVSLRPNTRLDPARTQSLIANRAAIYLSGRDTGVAGYLFFYDGAGVQTEIPIYYNGYAPSSPQVEGALASIASVSESARRDRFEEAVRTENVASRLRGGVITEVGPGSPATKGSAGAAAPAGCSVSGGDGSSGQSPLSCASGG